MNKHNKQWKSTVATIIIMSICAMVIICAYKSIQRDRDVDASPSFIEDGVSMLLDTDFETDYPETAREVIQKYLKIMNCFYNETLTEAQIEKLAMQSLLLMDDELCKINPLKDYITALKKDMLKYESNNIVIKKIEVEKSNTIRYYNKGKDEYASVNVTITTIDSEIRYQTKEEFILRLDAKHHYKILGWTLIS